jgi:hypothetical protein
MPPRNTSSRAGAQGNSGHPQPSTRRPLRAIDQPIVSTCRAILRTSKFDIAQEWAADGCQRLAQPAYAKSKFCTPSLIESLDRLKTAPTHEAMRQAARIMLAEADLTKWVYDDDGNLIVLRSPGGAPDDPDQSPPPRRQHLRLVTDNAKPQPSDDDDDDAAAPVGAKQQRFAIKRFADIKLSTARNYLIKGLLPRRGLAVIWGPPKSGKSFVAFDMAMHIALGQPYRDCRVQQGSVAYLALEGGGGFPARKAVWEERKLGDHVDPNDVPFYLLHDVSVDLIDQHNALIAGIREQIPEPPATVFIDTLNRALNGDENASKDMSNFIRAADAITATFGCLVVLIHHCGVVGNRPRGHTSLTGAADVQISVLRDNFDQTIVTVEYAKDFEPGPPLGCKLERVPAGFDEDKDELSSCVVVAVDLPPGAGKSAGIRLTSNQCRFLDILRSALRDRTISSDGINITRNELKKHCLSKGWIDDDDNKGRAKLSEMINNLAGKKLIGASKNMVWLLTAQA